MSNIHSDERTARLLGELRAAMSEIEAPAALKPAVLSEYESIRTRRKRVRSPVWGALAACVLLTVAGLYWRATRNENKGPAPRTVVNAPELRPVTPEVPKQLAVDPPLKHPPRRARRRRTPEPVQAAETKTEFVALPSAPPLDPSEGGSIVRIAVPRSAMRRFGIPVEENEPDRVHADVMLGPDGVARAVRFVDLQTR